MNVTKNTKSGTAVDKPVLPVVCPAGTFKELYTAGKCPRRPPV